MILLWKALLAACHDVTVEIRAEKQINRTYQSNWQTNKLNPTSFGIHITQWRRGNKRIQETGTKSSCHWRMINSQETAAADLAAAAVAVRGSALARLTLTDWLRRSDVAADLTDVSSVRSVLLWLCPDGHDTTLTDDWQCCSLVIIQQQQTCNTITCHTETTWSPSS